MSSDSSIPPFASIPPSWVGADEVERGCSWGSTWGTDHPEEGDLAATLLRLREALADVLPAGLVLREVAPGCALHGDAALVDLLLIQLVLSVRDLAIPGQLILEVNRVGEDWVRVTVRGDLPVEPGEEDLRLLRDLAEALDGSVASSLGGLSVQLPSREAPRPEIVVLCRDPRVAEALVAEIERWGGVGVRVSTGAPFPPQAVAALVEEEVAVDLAAGPCRVVRLVPRRALSRAAHLQAGAPADILGVPWLVHELDSVLAAAVRGDRPCASSSE